MKSRNVSRTKLGGDGNHSRVTLNTLHFDFRNAKPAFLGVSYCKIDDAGTNPDVRETQLKPSHVECNQGDVLRCDVDGTISKTVTGSAVQVDDGDSDGLVDVSNAAAQHHTCSAVTTPERSDRNLTCTSLMTECMQPTDSSWSDCTVAAESNILPPSDTSSSSPVLSLLEKQSDFCNLREQKAHCTETSVADNRTDLRADTLVLKPLSVYVNEVSAHNENMEHPLRSSVCNTEELSGTGINSLPSNAPAISLFEDAFDDVPSNVQRSCVQSTRRVKKSVRSRKPARSKNFRSLDTVTAAGISDDAKYKDIKPKLLPRTMKRRQRIKYKSEDDVWSTHKKLLIMPLDKKCSNSGRGRKRNTRTKRDIFAPIPKRKRKSVSVTGTELPDLSTTLDTSVDNVDMPDVLYSWVSDVDDKPGSVNASKKWCIDITGADLTIDLTLDCEQNHVACSDKQNCFVPVKPAKHNVNQVVTHYPTDTERCHANFSSSQETPPPSVASDGFSSCDESVESVRSNSLERETHKSSNTQWLYFDTKLARYIDGRHFDRLVNGVSVQVPMTFTSETLAQVGQECLHLEKLTKRDLKELQNQVRLEEIYHRRVKKSVFSPYYGFNERFNYGKRSARLRDSGDVKTATEANAVDQQSASFAVGGLYQSAAKSDDETLSYLSSDDNETVEPEDNISEPGTTYASELLNKTVEPENIISKPGTTYTSELLHGSVTETCQRTDDSCVNDNGTTELVSVPICVRIRRRDKNKLQKQNQPSECTPINVYIPEQTPVPSNCANSDSALAVSNSQVSEASSQQISTSKTTQEITGFGPDANQPGADSIQDSITTRTDKSDTDAAGTDESEYVAAIALASLSVTPLSTDTALSNSQTNNDNDRTVTEADAHVTVRSKSTQGSSPQRLTTQSSASKATSIKPPKHNGMRNGHRNVKNAERRAERVSVDKHSSESAVIEVSNSEVQRSGGHRSQSSAKASGDGQRVTRSKEKLSVNGDRGSTLFASSSVTKNRTEVEPTKAQRPQGRRPHSVKAGGNEKHSTPSEEKSLSEFTVNSDDRGFSCVVTGSEKKATGTLSRHNVSENNRCAVSDNTRHTRHRSENCHSTGNTVIDSCKNEQVADNSFSQHGASPSKQTKMIESDDNDFHANTEMSDLPSRTENVEHFDDTITSSSANNCTDTSMLCTSVSMQSSVVFSSSSSHASHSLIGLQAVVECSDKETTNGEQKILANLQEVSVTMTLPLSGTDESTEVQDRGMDILQARDDEVIEGTVRRQAGGDEVIGGSVRHQAGGDEVIEGTVRHQAGSDAEIEGTVRHQAGDDEEVEGTVRHQAGDDKVIGGTGTVGHQAGGDEVIEGTARHEAGDDQVIGGTDGHQAGGDEEVEGTVRHQAGVDEEVIRGTVGHQAGDDEVIKGTIQRQVLSDLNSNNLLKSPQISLVTEKLCGDDAEVAQVVSVNADTGLPKLSDVPNAEVVSDRCLLAGGNDTNVPAPNSLQPSVISADLVTQSPDSPCQELEDIRSPSPALADMEEDDRAREIRSPSPCELESHTSLFRVIETSWDVRLTSPCEIQSPDCSEDEVDNSVEEFSRHCNVCFHQGPVTIPLTITEASKRTHNQQPDMA